MRKLQLLLHSAVFRLSSGDPVRYMYDGISPDADFISRAFPHASLVAGYDTGGWAWSPQAWALFPRAKRIKVTTSASYNEGDVLDVENGDAVPAQTHDWIHMRKADGYHRPTIYCNRSTIGAVREGTREFVLGFDYDLWIAEWTGFPHYIPGVAATQYANFSDYDVSAVYDSEWPRRKAPKPVRPHLWARVLKDQDMYKFAHDNGIDEHTLIRLNSFPWRNIRKYYGTRRDLPVGKRLRIR